VAIGEASSSQEKGEGMSKIVLQAGDVIDFLVQSGALKFGDFTLKSGRKAPYFINTGCFDDGVKIARLARFYAQQIVSLGLQDVDAVFGPAYKGIPLCVATAMSLAQDFGVPMGFCFNRKEAKTRGEGGEFVGKPLTAGMRVVLVEDVVTAGTTLQEMVPLLRNKVGLEIARVVILVDRDERGSGELSAVQEAERDLEIKVTPIVDIKRIISYLSAPNSSGFQIPAELQQRIATYREEYGAR
jgi:orotate phosphoribosyltransferase